MHKKGCIGKYIGFVQIMCHLERHGFNEEWRSRVQKIVDHRNMPDECEKDATVAEIIALISTFLKMRECSTGTASLDADILSVSDTPLKHSCQL